MLAREALAQLEDVLLEQGDPAGLLIRLAGHRDRIQELDEAVRGNFRTVQTHIDQNGLGAIATQRLLDAGQNYAKAVDGVLGALEPVLAGETAGLVDFVSEALDVLGSMEFCPPPGFYSGPTAWESIGPIRAPVMQDDVVYEDDDTPPTPPGAEDLLPTIDVQITQEIIDKAAELGNDALAMYEFVRHECEFQPYLGSRKGSVETLRQRSGNDYDLASLLIALLRASDISARYVEGQVRIPVEQANSWLGVDDGYVAGSILTTRGLEGVTIVSGDEVVAIRCRRVWVAAWVPRGYGAPTWVPLDPAFKQHEVHAGIDIPAEMGVDVQEFIDGYYDPDDPNVVLPREETVLELFEQAVSEYVAVNYPDETLQSVMRTQAITPQQLGELPASLPYRVLSYIGDYAEISADRRYQVRFHLHDGGTTLIDHTFDLPAVASKRITISYVGATEDDQAIIDSYNGLLYTPPYLVDVTPVLKVGGETVAIGVVGIGAGVSHASDLHFMAPVNGAGLPENPVPAIYNDITAGENQAIGVGVHGVTNPLLAPTDPADTESFLMKLRDATAMGYMQRCLAADDELGALMHLKVTTDVDDAILQDQLVVTLDGWGDPLSWEWRGLTVDADRKIVGIWRVDQYETGCEGERYGAMILGGAEGSLYESLIFESDFSHEAVSTIKILELAADQGITIYHRWDSTTLPGGVTLPSNVRSAIISAIAGGHVVTFPASQITYCNWTGCGYIDLDPCSGAAGYIIAGGQSGGSTVDEWTDIVPIDQADRTVDLIEGAVDVPAIDSPEPGALFAKEDTTPLHFEYRLRVHYPADPPDYPNEDYGPWLPYSHDSLPPSQLPAGHYTLAVGDRGDPADDQHERKLSIVQIKSETVATTPNDRIRTKLGIAERVECTVDPAISVTWSVSGGGAVSPVTGTTTTLTASRSPSNSEVKATVGTFECALGFSVIAPNGMTSVVNSNPGLGTAGPPNNYIGACTIFTCTVQPADVTFNWAEFRENIPGEAYVWPDTTPGTRPADLVYWGVGQDNKTTDTVSSAPEPIGRLDPPPPGGGYVDFSFDVRVPEEYYNQAGNWMEWLPGENHPREYSGATQDCRVCIEATNTACGSRQGPWR